MKPTLSYNKPLQKTTHNSLKQRLLSVCWVQIFPQHLNIDSELIHFFHEFFDKKMPIEPIIKKPKTIMHPFKKERKFCEKNRRFWIRETRYL